MSRKIHEYVEVIFLKRRELVELFMKVLPNILKKQARVTIFLKSSTRLVAFLGKRFLAYNFF